MKHKRNNVFRINRLSKVLLLLCFLGTAMITQAQTAIEGIVRDVNQEPLVGVSIIVKGTTAGSITDNDGKFTINAAAGATLEFSSVGYVTQTIAAANNMEVVLVEDAQQIDDVVVVGYGVQKKSVVTAAISRVTAEQLTSQKPSRVEDVLKGKISGVQITQSSGQPGSDSKIRIRGVGTVNNSDPLFIVDGMPVDGGIIYLNPADIESVEILKDAASGAIYGARAANGVILVTTKTGSIGKTNVNYNFSYGWQNPWKLKSMLDAKEYMVIRNEQYINDGESPYYTPQQIADAGSGTNWQKETFNFNAPVQNHQISVNGGNQKVQYFVSFGYFDQEGIVGGNYGLSNYKRYSLRSNSTYTVFDETKSRSFLNVLKIGVNAGYSRGKSTGLETNSEFGSVLGSALAFSPLVRVYADDTEVENILRAHPYAVKDKNGRIFSLPPDGFQEIANPVAMLNRPYADKNNEDKLVGTLWAELDIYQGLKFKSSYGFDLAFWGNDGYQYPHFLATQGKDITQSSVWSSMNRGYKWQIENVLSYNKTFAELHNLTVVLGQSAQEYTYRNVGGTDYDLIDTNPIHANINSAIADEKYSKLYGGTGGYTAATLASYFGRLDYNFAERYIFQFTLRGDGSSNFGANNKWGIFPAASLGWNITNESFMESRPKEISLVKLRGSWGRNGNERIAGFTYTSLLDGGQNYYFGGGYSIADKANNGVLQYGTSPGALANPDIKWEESEQLNIGIDTRFFNNALSFTFDYFTKKTNGMLITQPIPSYVGQSAPTGNVGDMQNWGLEFEVGWKQTIGDFSYNLSANASYLQNKLVNLGNASGESIYESSGATGVGSYVKGKNGDVFPYFYGYKTDGVFQNQAEINAYKNSAGELLQPKAQPGDVRFVDFNQDGKINDDDKTKIGKGTPDWVFGFTASLEWKGIDLNLFFQGSAGNDIFDLSQRGDIPGINRPTWILERWHGEGTSNRIPRMTAKNPNGNWASSDLYIKDGSYLRLKGVQLGYTLPQDWTQKIAIQKFRIFVSGENLLTFTKYDGFEPELAAGGFTTMGVDKGIYPQSRTFSIGANITF